MCACNEGQYTRYIINPVIPIWPLDPAQAQNLFLTFSMSYFYVSYKQKARDGGTTQQEYPS